MAYPTRPPQNAMLPPQGYNPQYYAQQGQLAAMHAAQAQAQAAAGQQGITQQQLMAYQMQVQLQAQAQAQAQAQQAQVQKQQQQAQLQHAQAQAQAQAHAQAQAQAAAAAQAHQAQAHAHAHAQAQAAAQAMGTHPHQLHAMQTPSRPSMSSHPSMSHQQQYRQQQVVSAAAAAAAAPPPRAPTAYHNETYPPGPLGFFLPPPGQRSLLDPTLSTPPVTQAFYTTYPTRLRTGVTSLIQPENVTGGTKEREAFLAEMDREIAGVRSSGTNTPRIESPAPAGRLSRTTTTTMSGRRAGRVNYAEQEDSDDDEESSEEEVEEAASDPEDETFGERRRRRDPLMEREMQNRIVRIKRKQTEMERGWTWLGDRVPAERVRSAIAKVTQHPTLTEAMLRDGDTAEMLIPISIDYDIPSPTGDGNGIKIKDRFLWNAADRLLKPIQFARILCDDLNITGNDHVETIANLISAQIEEAQSTAFIDLQTPDVTPDDVLFSDDETEDREEGKFAEPDCRIVVNLDVQIFTHVLQDRIEWDLSSPLPPSEFARHYCAELGLTGEAIPLVAHAIHEELQKHKRDALELDLFAQTHPSEQAKWEKTIGQQPRTTNKYGARRLVGVWRDWWERDEFSPILVELSTEEIERREQERGREARRMMRTLNTSKRRR